MSQLKNLLSSAMQSAPAMQASKVVSKGLDSSSRLITRISTNPTIEDLRSKYNQITGYDQVEQLKRELEQKDQELGQVTKENSEQKAEWYKVIEARGIIFSKQNTLQHEKNNLTTMMMQGRNTGMVNPWVLTRLPQVDQELSNLANEDAKEIAKENELQKLIQDSERRLQNAREQQTHAMLVRYQTEQSWSDKIRKLSSYVTVGLMGLNTVIFLFSQSRVARQVNQSLQEWKEHQLPAVMAVSSATPQQQAQAPPPAESTTTTATEELSQLMELVKENKEKQQLLVDILERIQTQPVEQPRARTSAHGDVSYILGSQNADQKLLIGATVVAAVCSGALLITNLMAAGR